MSPPETNKNPEDVCDLYLSFLLLNHLFDCLSEETSKY